MRFAILVLLLCVGCHREIRVDSIPSGAKLWVDGVYRGKTPTTFGDRQRDELHSYQLRLEVEGKEPVSTTLAQDGRSVTPEEQTLRAAVVVLAVGLTIAAKGNGHIGLVPAGEERSTLPKDSYTIDIEALRPKPRPLGQTPIIATSELLERLQARAELPEPGPHRLEWSNRTLWLKQTPRDAELSPEDLQAILHRLMVEWRAMLTEQLCAERFPHIEIKACEQMLEREAMLDFEVRLAPRER